MTTSVRSVATESPAITVMAIGARISAPSPAPRAPTSGTAASQPVSGSSPVTVVPVVILVAIAVPSFRLLYFADQVADADMTLKVIGRQWYWSYEYPDHGNFTFDATLVPEEDLKEGELRLLTTDNKVVLPINTKIRLLITASDVLHAFALPDMGVKLDAVPGQINETWVEILHEGTFYGQCSEICGINHAYMPIMIEAVSKEKFDAWVVKAQEEFAKVDTPTTAPLAAPRLAQAQQTR